ncbi:uncharacterized protein LOC132630345 [Lycium barbarum]|uniref:uncharacterized protein LOC132630345 n=1 Tax=Lycium barbarum TaxID=112863 RepID=UPI00293E78E3|nr:uncharacterized protein LOC132630345 [Lycium barbarum]
MKKSGIFVASLTAASATATSSSKVRISHHQDDNLKKKDENLNSSKKVAAPKSSDKFAPKFDGLRFIETLVTAHR